MKLNITVVSGSSGTGTSSLIAELCKLPNYSRVVTLTTREKRAGEVDGIDYTFVSSEEFLNLKESGQILASSEFNGTYYGIDKSSLVASPETCLLIDLSADGALEVRGEYPDNTSLIFVMAPSRAVAHQRLIGRGMSKEEILAREKVDDTPIASSVNYDFLVVNYDQNLQLAVELVRGHLEK